MFLPCTVNLDPKLREIIADVRDARDQMPLGGMGYPALQEGPSRSGASVFGHHHSAALSPGGPGGPFPPAGGPLHHPHPPQPHSSYYSGLTGPQHPFYNRALAGSAAAASAVPSAPWAPLSSLGTDAMCERLKQVEGLDPGMLEQYTTTIKKANVNGRVLSQCNLDELKNEMNMNFGDWQLFRAMVMEQRNAEMQPMHMPMHDESHAGSELGSIGGAVEDGSCSRRGPPGVGGPPSAALSADPAMRYSLNLSFEELSAVGLEEPQKQTNAHWTAPPNHRSSMTSLNSQESSNDICKLTDKQQAEYRNAYQEYIAQMAQIEGLGTGAERPPVPVPPYPLLPPAAGAGAESDTAKEGEQQQQAAEGRGGSKPFPKGRSKVTDTCDGDAQLDPITEEDEKADAAGAAAAANARALLSRKSKGLRYHQVPGSDEEEEEESDSSTPLLSREERRRQQQEAETHRPPESIPLLLARAKAEYLSEAVLDKKESSDSGHRSSGSSSDHSLQDADSEPEKADPKGMPDDPLAALEMLQPGPEAEEEEEEEVPLLLRKHALPRNLSGLQQDVMRMSICSEAASEASSIAMASSPEENWPTPTPTPTKVIFNRSASSSPEENWSTPTQTPTPTGTPTPTPNANLNRSASSGAINNNSSSTNNSQHAHALHETITPTSTTTNMGSSSSLAIDSPPIIISPGSSNPTTSITTTALLHNQNLRAALHRKRSAAAADGHADEERESVL